MTTSSLFDYEVAPAVCQCNVQRRHRLCSGLNPGPDVTDFCDMQAHHPARCMTTATTSVFTAVVNVGPVRHSRNYVDPY